jgi:hypothetical protein
VYHLFRDGCTICLGKGVTTGKERLYQLKGSGVPSVRYGLTIVLGMGVPSV